MKFFGVLFGLGLLAFVVYQLVGLIKDIKKKKQQKQKSVEEKEKTE